MNTNLVAPWQETRWLCLSSSLFFISAIYGSVNKITLLYPPLTSRFNQCNFYTLVLTFCGLISANYWYYPVYFSWSRTLDLIFAKFSFFVFTASGIYYLRTPVYVLAGYSNLFLISYFYWCSNNLYSAGKDNWFIYHGLFHFFMMIVQLIILKSINLLRKSTFSKRLKN
jgi:hypothetical protein